MKVRRRCNRKKTLKEKGWKQCIKCKTKYKGFFCPNCSNKVYNKERILQEQQEENKQWMTLQ